MKSRSNATRFLSLTTSLACVAAGNLRQADPQAPVLSIFDTLHMDSHAAALSSHHSPQQPSSNVPLITLPPSGVVPQSTEIHILAATGDLEGLQSLLNKEPYWISVRDEHGWTALHEAARGAHIEALDFLLSRGAELNAQTYTGATPLYEAEKYNGKDSRVVRYLNSLGAVCKEAKSRLRGGLVTSSDDDLISQRIPHQMAAEGRMDELNQLSHVRGSWVLGAEDEHQWTPLHEAARAGQVHVVRFLLDRGMDINCLSREGMSPLHYARIFQGQDSEVAKFLEDEGALDAMP